jgi:phage shock protein A
MQTQKLLDRIALLLQVSLADLLMDEADPQEAVAHWRAEAERGLSDAQDAVARAIVQERQMEKQLRGALSSSAAWDAKVDAALQAGDEGRARAALRRKATYDQSARAFQEKLDHHRLVLSEMKASLRALQVKAQDLTGLTNQPIGSGRKSP